MAFCEIPKGSINTQGNDTRRFFEFCSIHARAKGVRWAALLRALASLESPARQVSPEKRAIPASRDSKHPWE